MFWTFTVCLLFNAWSLLNSLTVRSFADLIAIANSLDPDQAHQYGRPDLNSKLFDSLMVFLKEFLKKKKSILRNISRWPKKCKITQQEHYQSVKQIGPRLGPAFCLS